MPDCGNPYLSWHHFNPPWSDEHHHRPDDMIALCREHADKADGGAFPNELLREWKKDGAAQAQAIEGKFDWMRHTYLAVIGSVFYYENATILQIGERRCIWFSRDEKGYQLLNFWMPTVVDEPRARIYENGWIVPPNIKDLECPPHGKLLRVWYANGDRISFEFREMANPAQLVDRYAAAQEYQSAMVFPLTVVEISERAAGSPIELGPKMTKIGAATMEGGFMHANKVGIHIDAPAAVKIPANDDAA